MPEAGERHSTRDKGHEEGGSAYAKVGSSLGTSWQIDGEAVETGTDFICLGSKITADGDCNHEIKRLLLLGRKAMTTLDSMFKSRNVTLLTKFGLVEAMAFLVVICESDSLEKKK